MSSKDPVGFLRELAPQLYEVLHSGLQEPGIDKVEHSLSKSGSDNLIVTSGPKRVSLHSAYPDKEAEKLLARLDYSPQKLTVVFGLGLGHHVELFLKLHPKARLVILEPGYSILQVAAKYRDLEDWFRNPNITIAISPHGEELGQMLCSSYNFHQNSGVQFLELPSYSELFKDILNDVKKVFLNNFSKFTANVATIMESDNDFIENSMRNVRHFSRFPWASSLFSQFQKVPAIVISAGPSLYLQLPKLRKLREQAILIAVDTAYPILQKAGVEPHFVCTADPNDENFIHLRGLDVSKTFLVVEPMTWHETLGIPDAKAFISNFDGYYASYFACFAKDRSKILSWGSIASTCFDLARKLGSDPIIFVGQDLAYSDLLTHCPGSKFDERYHAGIAACPMSEAYTSYQNYHLQMILQKPLTKVLDIHERVVLTQHNLKLYAGWLQEQFKESPQQIINATERGILKEHCTILPFAEVMDKYLNQSYPIRERIQQLYQNRPPYNHQALLQDLQFKVEQLEVAKKVARQLQDKCRELEKTALQRGMDARLDIQSEFSTLTTHANCNLQDAQLLSWMEHKNQKAEVFFQRSLAKLVGSEFSIPLIQDMANLYHSYFESKFKTFEDLIFFLRIAIDGCWEALGE